MKTPIIKSQLHLVIASLIFFILFEVIFFYKLIQVFKVEHIVWVQVYITLSALFLLSRPIMTLFYKDTHEEKHINLDNYRDLPSVSFIIAAKNEENSIYRTIETCIKSEYKGSLECIVVNDGSTDNTLQEMQRAEKEMSTSKKKIKVFNFEINKGKREGMYEGIMRAKGEILVFVDSDSFLKQDALAHIVSHFIADSKLGAVSGNTMVENRETFLSKMQSARYAISFDIFKACESVFGVVTCCPGCFSAYRAEVVRSVIDDWKARTFFGSKATFGDDRSLTNFVLDNNWKVSYCRGAHATTVVPDNYRQFIKQQLRWKKSWIREGFFGAARFMWKKHPIASLSFYINLLIPVIGPFIVFSGLILKIIDGEWKNVLFFIVSVSLLSFVYGLFTYALTRQKDFIYSVPFTIFYSFFLVWQMPWAIIRLRDNSWGTR